jgi:hypothetical protein
MATADGIRCPYHGWEFSAQGKCLDQPFGRDNPSFREKVSIDSYPVQELGGLVFAYLGPQPAPLLPRFDGLVVEGAVRTLGRAELPCNWLQIVETSVDPVHAEWLHGRYIEFAHEAPGVKTHISAPHEKIDFKEFEYGITKHRLLAGQPESLLDRVLREWVLEFFPHAQDELLAVLSIDGKTLCGSARVLRKGVHLLSLVVHGSRAVLAQSRVDEKTNEHKGALELLEKVLLKDVVIVGDAAFCHRDLCQQILNAEGHYVLAVKENQPTLYREISQEFQAANAALSSIISGPQGPAGTCA